jgi:hypothetical protein
MLDCALAAGTRLVPTLQFIVGASACQQHHMTQQQLHAGPARCLHEDVLHHVTHGWRQQQDTAHGGVHVVCVSVLQGAV